MISASMLLVILALVFFLLAAVGVPASRVNFVAAGLFCWLLSTVIR